MSVFKDYLQATVNGIKNIDKVAESRFNEIKDKFNLLPEAEKQEIDRRTIICAGCPFNSTNAELQFGYESELKYYHCSICKCPIENKVMALTSTCAFSLLIENNANTTITGFKPLWGPFENKN